MEKQKVKVGMEQFKIKVSNTTPLTKLNFDKNNCVKELDN